MRLILVTALFCTVSLCEEIVSEGSQIHYYSSDTDGHGDHDDHEFEEGGFGLQKNDHGSHGQSHHGSGEEVSDHGKSHHSQYDLGSYDAQGSKGGHHGENKKYHDKGYYAREKKYGYEKAYGYDKVTKHHDKGGDSHSYGASHSQNSQHSEHKKGAKGGQSHDHHAKKHQYGGQKHSQYGHSLDKHGHHKKGRDHYNRIYQKYTNAGHPSYKYSGFSSGIGGGLGGLHDKYGFGAARAGRFPLWQKYYGNRYGGLRNGRWKYKNYGQDDDGDFSTEDFDGGIGNAYKTYGDGYYAGEPVGLTGLGGGLGPHGHYFIKRNGHSYRS